MGIALFWHAQYLFDQINIWMKTSRCYIATHYFPYLLTSFLFRLVKFYNLICAQIYVFVFIFFRIFVCVSLHWRLLKKSISWNDFVYFHSDYEILWASCHKYDKLIKKYSESNKTASISNPNLILMERIERIQTIWIHLAKKLKFQYIGTAFRLN